MKGDTQIIRDKILKRISELFPTGADDEKIKEELSIIIPGGISISAIQRLREIWYEKATADRAMIEEAELEDAPTMSYREMEESNERWDQMMIHFECRKEYHMQERARISNIMLTMRNQRRKEIE